MVEQLNLAEFAAMVRTKRDGRGLRATATEIGEVSPSTLSRIEQGKVPDLDTFMRICRWLGVSPQRFMSTSRQIQSSPGPDHADTAELIAVHLRADRTLDPKTADALVQMIRLAYGAANQGKLNNVGEE